MRTSYCPSGLVRGRALRVALASCAFGATLAGSSAAHAQLDVNSPLPNVLLLVDTSGSMEYMADGSLPPTCVPGSPSSLNRWGTLLEVLTGGVKNRSCYKQSRGSAAFIAEYKLGSADPYDKGYFLPFHRLLSNNCAAGPGTLPVNAFDWPANAIK